MEEDKVLLLLLNEIKEMSRLQRDEKRPIQEMSQRISDCQNFFNSVVENTNTTNQSVVREIRSHLLRFYILMNPETRNMYRTGKNVKPPELLYKTSHEFTSTQDLFSEITDLTSKLR